MPTIQTKITDNGIKNHFKTTAPTQSIVELVWNGFDAKAKDVSVTLNKNALEGLDFVTVIDDGVGIDVDNIENNFGKFNESSKFDDFEQHGSKGRGRLAFHKISDQAEWWTKNTEGKQAKITITSSNLASCDWDLLSEEQQKEHLCNKKHGTYVVLSKINPKINLDENKLRNELSVSLGWFLSLNKDRVLKLNNKRIEAPKHTLYSYKEIIDGFEFDIEVFLWKTKPKLEKSYLYFLNEDNRIVYKKLSGFNGKRNFFISIYIKSQWMNDFEPKKSDLLSKAEEHNLSSRVFREVELKCLEYTNKIYELFLKEFVDEKIQKLEEQDAFPKYNDIRDEEQRKWREKNTKELVKEIYLADPNIFDNLNKKQQKIIIHLLDKLSISNENESLIDVLENILGLDSDNMKKFAKQLSKSRLENIIATIEILQRRESVIHKLKKIMNDYSKDILETPDLQRIIENNPWVFGNSYDTLIGAEEDSFTKNAYTLREKIPGINSRLTKEDVDEDNITSKALEGANRQVDLFLARKFPFFNSAGKQCFKCIIIEIKRPSIALNYKHLRQLDDYKRILQQYPEFSSENLYFELILVGRKISTNDTEIRGRINSLKDKLEPGLVTNDDRFKCYVKNWYTLFDEFELVNNYLLEKLKSQRESLDNLPLNELVTDLQTK